jgi:hypothetical protein
MTTLKQPSIYWQWLVPSTPRMVPFALIHNAAAQGTLPTCLPALPMLCAAWMRASEARSEAGSAERPPCRQRWATLTTHGAKHTLPRRQAMSAVQCNHAMHVRRVSHTPKHACLTRI